MTDLTIVECVQLLILSLPIMPAFITPADYPNVVVNGSGRNKHGYFLPKEKREGVQHVSNSGVVIVPQTQEVLLETLKDLRRAHAKRMEVVTA